MLAISVSKAQAVPPVEVAAALTVNESVQLCPPREMAKEAVPAAEGVPVMGYVTEPAPEANVPAANVAVNPVTPVEEMAEPAE